TPLIDFHRMFMDLSWHNLKGRPTVISQGSIQAVRLGIFVPDQRNGGVLPRNFPLDRVETSECYSLVFTVKMEFLLEAIVNKLFGRGLVKFLYESNLCHLESNDGAIIHESNLLSVYVLMNLSGKIVIYLITILCCCFGDDSWYRNDSAAANTPVKVIFEFLPDQSSIYMINGEQWLLASIFDEYKVNFRPYIVYL
ncbi:hypothetical protein Tco_0019812, partial [Tanacetum coccineum]